MAIHSILSLNILDTNLLSILQTYVVLCTNNLDLAFIQHLTNVQVSFRISVNNFIQAMRNSFRQINTYLLLCSSVLLLHNYPSYTINCLISKFLNENIYFSKDQCTLRWEKNVLFSFRSQNIYKLWWLIAKRMTVWHSYKSNFPRCDLFSEKSLYRMFKQIV